MITLISAIAENGCIGLGDKLPWRIPSEIEFFKKQISDGVLVVGKKTYDSLPAYIKKRNVIVLSSGRSGITIDNFLKQAALTPEVHYKVIGGAHIYGELVDFCDEAVISHIKGCFKGDAFFEFPDTFFNTQEVLCENDLFISILYKRIKSIYR